jgi:membrane-anchored mycosin MYCP
VVAVGARAQDESLASFSPRLPWITCTAPGVTVLGDYLDAPDIALMDGTKAQFDGYATWSGTSFATAITSGAIAARTVRGRVTARQALAELLAERDGVVRPYAQCDDGPRA